jgi:Protein of unknown function (DUF3995)
MARWSLCGILALLCLLHLYWAVGGKWARGRATPFVNGKPVIRINFIACLAMAFLLFLLAAAPVVAMKPFLRHVLLAGMALVFAGRAVGDFKYVGFFKSVKGTPFAYWDTRLYSPMNVLLAVLSAISLW